MCKEDDDACPHCEGRGYMSANGALRQCVWCGGEGSREANLELNQWPDNEAQPLSFKQTLWLIVLGVSVILVVAAL